MEGEDNDDDDDAGGVFAPAKSEGGGSSAPLQGSPPIAQQPKHSKKTYTVSFHADSQKRATSFWRGSAARASSAAALAFWAREGDEDNGEAPEGDDVDDERRRLEGCGGGGTRRMALAAGCFFFFLFVFLLLSLFSLVLSVPVVFSWRQSEKRIDEKNAFFFFS